MSGGIGGCVKQIGQDVPWLSAMCGYTLAPQHHEVLVIEDMLEDARCASRGPPVWVTDRPSCHGTTPVLQLYAPTYAEASLRLSRQ